MAEKTMKLKILVLALLILTGSVCLVAGYGIQAKAVLAQHLLHNSWEKSRTAEKGVKPWPWFDSVPVARLKMERLGVDLIVNEGEDGTVLAFGPGHISTTSSPLEPGNCVIVGHRDTSFLFLQNTRVGDLLVLQGVKGKSHSYEVVKMVVLNRDELYLENTDHAWLTLITCYPIDGVGLNPSKRMVVFARKVSDAVSVGSPERNNV